MQTRTLGKRFVDQHLVMAHAVEIAGIEEGDAGVQRGMDGGDALAPIGRAVHVRHAHATKSDGRNFRSSSAEFSMVHDWSSVTANAALNVGAELRERSSALTEGAPPPLQTKAKRI